MSRSEETDNHSYKKQDCKTGFDRGAIRVLNNVPMTQPDSFLGLMFGGYLGSYQLLRHRHWRHLIPMSLSRLQLASNIYSWALMNVAFCWWYCSTLDRTNDDTCVTKIRRHRQCKEASRLLYRESDHPNKSVAGSTLGVDKRQH